MSTPGLMLVQSHILPTTTEEKFNNFYNNTFAPAILADSPAELALRYKIHSPKDAENNYLALYPGVDGEYLGSPELRKLLEKTNDATELGGGKLEDYIHFDRSTWIKIDTMENPDLASERGGNVASAQTLSTVFMEPADAAYEAEFREWYPRMHQEMLKEAKGYRRSTIYQKREGQEGPKYLGLHEYACGGNAGGQDRGGVED